MVDSRRFLRLLVRGGSAAEHGVVKVVTTNVA
jgi:hypothetical protein